MNKTAKTKKNKIGFFRKIGVKIALLVGATALISCTVCMVITISQSTSAIQTVTANEIMSLISAYSTQVETKLQDNQNLTYVAYQGLIGNLKITGVNSSYAYVVDSNGMIIYHPQEDKIGKTVENSAIKGLVAKIQKGQRPKDEVVQYRYKGEEKYAGYKILSNNNILVAATNKDEVLSSVTHMTTIGTIGGICVMVICTLLGILMVIFIIRPIKALTSVIDETAALDFSDDKRTGLIAKRRDEIGMMGKSVMAMRTHLRDMVQSIQSTSRGIWNDVEKLQALSNEIREDCTDNSATTEELAAGMEETSATTGTITHNIDDMKTGADDIAHLSEEGMQLSDEIRTRADSLKDSTDLTVQKTKQMYETILEKSQNAMKAAECVQEINAMTESIMQISSQTSLLSLNASIEAARAGDAGKGFAVVASEISKLAGETSDSVTQIDKTVEQVNASVDEMVKSMTDTTAFLKEIIAEDYTQFGNVSMQYSNDAETFRTSMTEVEDSILKLANSIAVIADAITGINATVDESSIGVSDIAEKTGNVVQKTKQNAGIVEECMKSVDTLEEISKKFKL